MKHDFFELYKSYSNIELLKIIGRQSEYQADAVDVAVEILKSRDVSQDEVQFVEKYFQELDHSIQLSNDRIEKIKQNAGDLLEPILHPSRDIESSKRINIFIVLVSLQYTWYLLSVVTRIFRVLHRDSPMDIFLMFIDAMTLVLYPGIIYLLYKRKKWGWILVFGENLLSLILLISQSYTLYKYREYSGFSVYSFMLGVSLKAAILGFLLLESVSQEFKISIKNKKRTIIYGCAVTLAIILFTLWNTINGI